MCFLSKRWGGPESSFPRVGGEGVHTSGGRRAQATSSTSEQFWPSAGGQEILRSPDPRTTWAWAPWLLEALPFQIKG